MLTIIHGTDISASRKYFMDEKQKNTGALLLSENAIEIRHMLQILDGGDLFDEKKVLFIEQFLAGRKKSAEKEAIISFLIDKGKTHDIFLWEGKELTPANLTPFRKNIIKNFKLHSSLFSFLDSIKPGNGRQMTLLFHDSLISTEPEMVFFMLVRQIRILLALSDTGQETISEAGRLAPWQKGKLANQAILFNLNDLKKLYARLFEIEKGQKTGTLTMSLTAAMDFILADI